VHGSSAGWLLFRRHPAAHGGELPAHDEHRDDWLADAKRNEVIEDLTTASDVGEALHYLHAA
jgi:hypothetical protein